MLQFPYLGKLVRDKYETHRTKYALHSRVTNRILLSLLSRTILYEKELGRYRCKSIFCLVPYGEINLSFIEA